PTRLRRRGSSRYVPCRRECSEVIEADRVDVAEQGPQAIDAPAVATRGQRVPVIDRIAPELSSRAEVVRRHTGDDAWPVLPVEQEQLGVGPHVARIRRDEEGQVTDQAHAFGEGMGLQAGSLTEQQELSKSNLVRVARQISPRPVERGRRSADEILWPLEITGAVVSGLESAEQRV